MTLEGRLIKWYLKNKRDLPWRNTKNPYEIWISEVILQQTRVNQAISYYYAFLDSFPSVSALANASEHEVLKSWQGLGYYSRARNLHTSAKYIMNELKGKFPENYKDLIQLKGIGEYTAAAIASFSYHEKVAVVDGNVYRLLSRIYAEPTPINSLKGKKLFFELASNMIEHQEPYLFNQAIMEFGAIQCTPKNPNCSICDLQQFCLAYSQNKVGDYPVKTKSIKKRDRFLYYFFIENNGHTYIKKRGSNDIWQGLFEFPLIETNTELNLEKLSLTDEWNKIIGNYPAVLDSISKKISHQLTHQQLFIQFFSFKTELTSTPMFTFDKDFQKIAMDDLINYPVPKPIENFIQNNSSAILQELN